MSPLLWYLAGAASTPAALGAWAAVDILRETGTETTCRLDGYTTGSLYTTSRARRVARWRWHRITNHRRHEAIQRARNETAVAGGDQ